MSSIPLVAICDNCQTAFPSVGFGLPGGGSGSAAVIGCQSGPCPKCGGMGSIPDGIYEWRAAIEPIAALIDRGLIKIEQIKQVITTINNAPKEDDPAKVADEIVKEIPELSDWRSLIPKTRMEAYAALVVLATYLGLLLRSCGK